VDRLETLEGPLYLGKDVIRDLGGSHWHPSRRVEGEWGVRNLIYGTSRSDCITGANKDDVLFGVGGSDLLRGGSGNDTLVGGEGWDVMEGRDGHDTLYGNKGWDVLMGGSGNDVLLAGEGDDLLDGERGNDRLFGDKGEDLLLGGEGDDVLSGGRGDDILKGGAGDDLYVFRPGDGRDLIWDGEGLSGHHCDGGYDTIRLGDGIGREDVALFFKGNSLYVGYGEGDVVEAFHQKKERDRVERLELADGSYLTDGDVNRVIQEICAYAAREGIALRSVEDVRRNEELMMLVVGSWQQ
jgi:Ca2+-binding RTX toxin-like protein